VSNKHERELLSEDLTQLLEEISIDDKKHDSKVLRVIAGALIGLLRFL